MSPLILAEIRPVAVLFLCLDELHILTSASFLAANSATFCCRFALTKAIYESFLGESIKLLLGHRDSSGELNSKFFILPSTAGILTFDNGPRPERAIPRLLLCDAVYGFVLACVSV